MRIGLKRTGAAALAICAATLGLAQLPAAPRPEDTEMWEPVPRVVMPATTHGGPPSDAIVLFDGSDLDEWIAVGGGPARWLMGGGELMVDKASGDIETRRSFRDYQLHVEFRIPPGTRQTGQERGNSGVFLAATASGGYELQILDSHQNATYANGQAASVYKQFPPLVNASLPQGAWQSYDVIWTAPTFSQDGAVLDPAFLTAFHNGVLVQNHTLLRGETRFVGEPEYHAYDRAPIRLQAHQDPSPPISFRNIWVRELESRKTAR